MKKTTKHTKKSVTPNPPPSFCSDPTTRPASGPISVKFADQERLKTIQTIANALYELAKQIGKPLQVTVQDCIVSHADIGIQIGME